MSCTRWLTQGSIQNTVTSAKRAAARVAPTMARSRSVSGRLSSPAGGSAMLLVPLSMALVTFLPANDLALRPRPVATYSIVARDPATGDMGVAVQSHWFSVGAVVLWAEAGVGAVATQSFVEPSYGPLGLALMRAGRSAPEALAALLAADDKRAVREVGMVDVKGGVATFTGAMDIPAAGGQEGRGYVVQANLMEKATVWPAMARAYESAKGDLAERMLA